MNGYIYAIATMDTKGEELSFIAEQINKTGIKVKTIDVGTAFEPQVAPDVRREQIAACHSKGAESLLSR